MFFSDYERILLTTFFRKYSVKNLQCTLIKPIISLYAFLPIHFETVKVCFIKKTLKRSICSNVYFWRAVYALILSIFLLQDLKSMNDPVFN